MPGQTYDKERVSLNLARLKKAGQVFEIDIDTNLALDYKTGKNIDIKDILRVEKIFSDAKKGMLASEIQMRQLFGTSDALEVAKIILEKGEIQLTTEYRNKLREQRKKQIIDIIHRNGVDPKTHLPHPITRIENALEEAKFHVDEFKPVQKQVEEALKSLRSILPIKFEIKEIAVKIPAKYAAKSYSIVKSFGKILKDEWQKDGSWVVMLEIPGGLEGDFYDKINALCHGNIESRILKTR
jgi:ribosome maturation protein SDO1